MTVQARGVAIPGIPWQGDPAIKRLALVRPNFSTIGSEQYLGVVHREVGMLYIHPRYLPVSISADGGRTPIGYRLACFVSVLSNRSC